MARYIVAALVASLSAAQTLQKLGYYDYLTEESSPVVYNGKLLMFESILEMSPQWAGHWIPAFANCSCYFRVRDQYTGTVLVNITASCNHAFGAAFVQTNDEGLDTLFVFGTTWIREGASEGEAQQWDWSGPCSVGNCSIDSFYSSATSLQEWTMVTNTVHTDYLVYNQDVAHVGPPSAVSTRPPSSVLPPHEWVMAIRGTPAPTYPHFWISNSSDPTDPAGWMALDSTVYGYNTPATSEIGSCPSIRYDPATGWYYVLSGGTQLLVLRSQNLTIGSWQLGEDKGVFMNPDLNDCKQAPAPYGAWFNLSAYPDAVAHVDKCKAQPPTGLGFGNDSDVDLTEFVTEDGRVATLLQYGSGDQKTFGFSNLALYPGSMFQMLESFFE